MPAPTRDAISGWRWSKRCCRRAYPCGAYRCISATALCSGVWTWPPRCKPAGQSRSAACWRRLTVVSSCWLWPSVSALPQRRVWPLCWTAARCCSSAMAWPCASRPGWAWWPWMKARRTRSNCPQPCLTGWLFICTCSQASRIPASTGAARTSRPPARACPTPGLMRRLSRPCAPRRRRWAWPLCVRRCWHCGLPALPPPWSARLLPAPTMQLWRPGWFWHPAPPVCRPRPRPKPSQRMPTTAPKLPTTSPNPSHPKTPRPSQRPAPRAIRPWPKLCLRPPRLRFLPVCWPHFRSARPAGPGRRPQGVRAPCVKTRIAGALSARAGASRARVPGSMCLKPCARLRPGRRCAGVPGPNPLLPGQLWWAARALRCGETIFM